MLDTVLGFQRPCRPTESDMAPIVTTLMSAIDGAVVPNMLSKKGPPQIYGFVHADEMAREPTVSRAHEAESTIFPW